MAAQVACNDPFTMEARLCHDDGIVRSGPMHHGTDYPCTGHAHYAGEHIKCLSPAHAEAEQSAVGVCKTCGMPVRVVFVNDEPVRVLAPCGHPKLPTRRNPMDVITPANAEQLGEFGQYRKTAISKISNFTVPPGTTFETPEGLKAEDEEARIAFDSQGGVYPIRESVFQETYAEA